MKNIEKEIKCINNWPKEGVNFLDIGPILGNPEIFKETIDLMSKMIKKNGYTKFVGLDARGFIFASALAYKMNIGFAMARKKGKLPPKTYSCKYDLEYGTAELEISKGSISRDDKILIIDDVLATGGTAKATIDICKKIGATDIDLLFFIELININGRSKLGDSNVCSLIKR